MFAFVAGQQPANKTRVKFARAATAAIFAALGGCASTQTASNMQNAAIQTRVAQAVTEVEDDGLPAQTPPSPSIRTLADDPSEPFSRNYGGANPSAVSGPLAEPEQHTPLHKNLPPLPNDLPPAFRKQLATAMAENE